MTQQMATMLDPGALTIVLAGTFLATLARCGWHDLRAAFTALRKLTQSSFDAAGNRKSLAKTVREIALTGPLCADVPMPPDPSLARLVAAYLKASSLDVLHSAKRSERANREIARAQAVRTFEYAGELAPVFGLVGTLFAITQLAPLANASPVEITMEAIATAVLSSLYGVLTAHLICIPIARAIERRGEREEAAREELIEWFDAQLSPPRREPSLGYSKNIREVA